MKRLTAVLQFIDAIGEFTGKGVAYLLIVLTATMFTEVVSRYIFNKPLIWTHETSIYLYGGTGALAGVYALLHHRHVKIDILYSRLSLRGRAVMDVFTSLIFFFYLIMLVQATGRFAVDAIIANQHSSSPWAPPVYPMKIVMFMAAFLVLVQGSAQFIRDLFYAWRGKELL